MRQACYKKLEAIKIENQVLILMKRVKERFPDSGLSSVIAELAEISQDAVTRENEFTRHMPSVRITTFVLILLIISLLIYSLFNLEIPESGFNLFDIIQVTEAAINDIIFIAIAIFFLFNLETRIKRKKALKAIDELRALAHIIDMHQLSKDPQILLNAGKSTASSPRRKFTAFELGRYLDYCSEMLSMVGKISALYIQNINDSVVLSASNDIDSLTTGLCRKIWQKLIILHNIEQKNK